MTTYTAITSGQIDAGSPLDTTLAGQWTNNLLAVQEGDASAPKIQTAAYDTGSVDQAAIGAAAVGQSEIKETYQEVTFTQTVAVGVEYRQSFTATGGIYILGSENKIGAGEATRTDWVGVENIGLDSTSFVANWNQYILGAAAGGVNLTSRLHYLQASPPYFDADGELIGRYAFVEIDKNTGEIVAANSAPDAPWHYNGPTDIRGKLGKDGKKYRERKDMGDIPFTLAEARADIGKLREYNAAFAAADTILEEITQDIKDADMILIPRPMEPTADTVVVMLDPVSDLNHQLCEMCLHDEFSINELLHDGTLIVDSVPLNRAGPPGVPVHGFRWK